MVKKVIMNLDFSKASGLDCIPLVVLKNRELELSYILAELFNKCLVRRIRSLVFQIVGRFHQCSLYLRMLGKGLQLKTTTLLVFFLWLVKSLKNLWIMGFLITWGNVAFFLISKMVLDLLNQLQIFSLWYLIEVLGFLTGLGLLELWHLIYLRYLQGFAWWSTSQT